MMGDAKPEWVGDGKPWADYLSRSQVAERLRVSGHRVDAMRREGQLEGEDTPFGFLYSLAAVEALEAERAGSDHWRHRRGADA